jgi:putative hemolysin
LETIEADAVLQFFNTRILLDTFTIIDATELGLVLVLIFCAALVSGSESAYFSLKGPELNELEEQNTVFSRSVIALHSKPKTLLATILVANTLINILVAIIGTTLLNKIEYSGNELLKQIIDVVAVTFVLVLIGEVVPKVYASHHNTRFAMFMAYPLIFLTKLLTPVTYLLIRTSMVIENRMKKKGHNVSINDIRNAIELTSEDETSEEEKKILKGIISFGNTYAKQIMTSRVDIVAHDIHTPFPQLVSYIKQNQYSRIPIYNGSFDKIEGILYIKDLVAKLNEPDDFDWTKLIREPYFVPEMKKIDLLLQEFKQKKMHMAIVADEYGGTAGIITMEDILEEIVGDINDEFDEDDVYYSKLDNENYIFDGKTALTDVVRVMNLDDDVFEKIRGEAESIGGLVVELAGKIPLPKEKVEYQEFVFTVELSDRRRVRKVKVTKKQMTELSE